LRETSLFKGLSVCKCFQLSQGSLVLQKIVPWYYKKLRKYIYLRERKIPIAKTREEAVMVTENKEYTLMIVTDTWDADTLMNKKETAVF